MVAKPFLSSTTLLAILTLAGCGDSQQGIAAQGKVVASGKPIAGALINFFPESGGRPLGGPLDDQGRYSVTLPPGEYRVVIRESAPDLPDGWREGDPVPEHKKFVPSKYNQKNSTPLRLSVPAEASGVDQDFDVGG